MRTTITLFLVFISLVMVGRSLENDVTVKPTETKTIAPAVSEQQLIENQFDLWDGSHKKLVKVIKSDMNDPESFKHVETRYIDKDGYLLLTMLFRGKNAFGGVVTNKVVALAEASSGDIFSIEYQ
jgi:hypothetical protein